MNVYIVDDDLNLLASIKATLSARFDVQAFHDGASFLLALDSLAPGVALLDLAMPGMDGVAVHTALIDREAPIAVVFLTGRGGISEAVDAMRRGAADFLSKPIRRADLLTAVQGAGERLERLLREQRNRRSLARLSERERQVLQGLAMGSLSKVIAHELGISLRTVEMHRARICEKLGVSTTAAVAMASEAGYFRRAA